MFGGLAQFLAGMWAFKARDAIATLAHGTWGAYWLAYGILNILLATHAIAAPTPWYHNPEVGFWFFALAITTGIAALAATTESLSLTAVLSTLAAGAGILAGAYIYGPHGAGRRLGLRRLGRVGLVHGACDAPGRHEAGPFVIRALRPRALRALLVAARARSRGLRTPARGGAHPRP